jgi:di/tricarboxylate transporter
MIMGKGLEGTGALQPLALWLAKIWGARPGLASLLTLLISAVLSSFVNNTPVVVMLLPMLVGVAVRNKLSVSSMLMPVGLGTIIGGMATTIGTSTNLLGVAVARELGAADLGIFSFSLPVLIVGGIGLAYLSLLAPRLLPDRQAPMSDTSARVFNAALYVNDDSLICGKTFAQVLALTHSAMRVDRIQRGEGLFVAKLPSVQILAGDRLMVRDTPERLKEFEKQTGATLHDEAGATGIVNLAKAVAEQEYLAEIVVTRGAMLHRSTLAATRFVQRTGLLPLALHRARGADSPDITSHISLVPLRAGDIVLVQGTQQNLDKLKRSGKALVLDGTMDLPRTQRAELALAIMTLAILLAALGVLPIAASATVGVGALLATRCLTWQDAASALSLPLIIIIVTSLALGVALAETGGALYVAQGFVALMRDLPPPVILSAVLLVVTVLANLVATNAVGVIAVPIAAHVAGELGVAAEPFVVAVLLAANMSFATPFSYQTNLLVLSAGGYRFADFLRVGVPLALLMWVGFSIVLPIIYAL